MLKEIKAALSLQGCFVSTTRAVIPNFVWEAFKTIYTKAVPWVDRLNKSLS